MEVAPRDLTTSRALAAGEHHYLSTELEVAILRTFLRWTEGRIQASYERLKSLNIPFLPTLLAATESVATRIGVPQWFNALIQLSDPWTSSIDSFVGRRILNTIAFILQTSGHVRVVKSDGVVSPYPPTIEELESELMRLQSRLAMEQQEKDELQDTVRRVLAMVANENQGLQALLNHVQELEQANADADGVSLRIKELETELETARLVAEAANKENEELRRELAQASLETPTSSSTELEEEMERLQTLVDKGLLENFADDKSEISNNNATDEIEQLCSLVAEMSKEKESLKQEIIDIHTFRESTAGQQLHEMESRLAETNIQKTALEAENKKLRVALKKKAAASGNQRVVSRAETWDGVKA
ncbi:unnamed protein product [Aphanomyces euteiches]